MIYGWNSKVIKQAPFNGHQCPNCDSQTTRIVVYGSYFHLFWIPLFPYRKYLKIVCEYCKHDQKVEDVSPEVKQLVKQLKSNVRLPYYMFSGLGIIITAIIFKSIYGIVQDSRSEDYLKEPQANDIYHMYNAEEPSDYKYYLWKVIGVSGDSLDVTSTSFQYTQDPYKLEPEDGFYDIFYRWHKNDIYELFETEVILKVQRGYKPYTGFDREIVYELPIEEKNEN